MTTTTTTTLQASGSDVEQPFGAPPINVGLSVLAFLVGVLLCGWGLIRRRWASKRARQRAHVKAWQRKYGINDDRGGSRE